MSASSQRWPHPPRGLRHSMAAPHLGCNSRNARSTFATAGSQRSPRRRLRRDQVVLESLAGIRLVIYVIARATFLGGKTVEHSATVDRVREYYRENQILYTLFWTERRAL